MQRYFENDNKDRYFTKEQVEYYEKIYKPKMQKPERKYQIRNFRKSNTLGNGSFGTVYSGFDNEHGIVFAVKAVPLSKYSNATQDKKIKALQFEIDLLRTLNHKNIVKYLGSQKDEDCINIFLEYVSGGSLERIYKTYPMNENLLRVYTKQILEGLEYLHVNNVIHRDIKAANILLDSQGTCKLADFGSSKKYVGQFSQQFNSFCGTPYWMAPEVIRQSGHNRYADIWSLGCTVLEMIQGRPPWSEKNNISVLLAIADAKEPPKYPKTISNELKNFLDCCFKRDPYQRANVYELLRHQFINVQAKLQKYHFALDKIEEENTPGPTPSEYSRKVGSNRSANISSEGRDMTGQTGQSTGNSQKKRPGKFFPQSNQEVEKIEEEDENLQSVVTNKNQPQFSPKSASQQQQPQSSPPQENQSQIQRKHSQFYKKQGSANNLYSHQSSQKINIEATCPSPMQPQARPSPQPKNQSRLNIEKQIEAEAEAKAQKKKEKRERKLLQQKSFTPNQNQLQQEQQPMRSKTLIGDKMQERQINSQSVSPVNFQAQKYSPLQGQEKSVARFGEEEEIKERAADKTEQIERFNAEQKLKSRQIAQQNLSMDINTVKRKVLDQKRTSQEVGLSPVAQRVQVPLNKKNGIGIVIIKNSTSTLKSDLIKSPDYSSATQNMSPSQQSSAQQVATESSKSKIKPSSQLSQDRTDQLVSQMLQNTSQNLNIGKSYVNLADKIAKANKDMQRQQKFQEDNKQQVEISLKGDPNELSFGKGTSVNSGLSGGILGKILAKKSNQSSLNSSQIIPSLNVGDNHKRNPSAPFNLKTIQDKLKSNLTNISFSNQGKALKLDKAKLNTSGVIDKSVLQKILNTPKNFPQTPSQGPSISLILKSPSNSARKVHYFQDGIQEKKEVQNIAVGQSKYGNTIQVLKNVNKNSRAMAGVQVGQQPPEKRLLSIIEQSAPPESSGEVSEQHYQPKSRQSQGAGLKFIFDNFEQEGSEQYQPTSGQSITPDEAPQPQRQKTSYSHSNSRKNSSITINVESMEKEERKEIQQNEDQEERPLSKVEQFRKEAQMLILKTKQLEQRNGAPSPGKTPSKSPVVTSKQTLNPQQNQNRSQSSSSKDLIKQLQANQMMGVGNKEYLRPQLPNVTEECMSSASNLSYLSKQKKEKRKQVQMSILDDIAKEMKGQVSASPPSKNLKKQLQPVSPLLNSGQFIERLEEAEESSSSSSSGESNIMLPQPQQNQRRDTFDSESQEESKQGESMTGGDTNNSRGTGTRTLQQILLMQEQRKMVYEPDFLSPSPGGSGSRRTSLMISKQKTQNEPKSKEVVQGEQDQDGTRRKSNLWKLKTMVDNGSDNGSRNENSLNEVVGKSSIGISQDESSLKISHNNPSHIDASAQQNNSPALLKGNIIDPYENTQEEEEESEFQEDEEDEEEYYDEEEEAAEINQHKQITQVKPQQQLNTQTQDKRNTDQKLNQKINEFGAMGEFNSGSGSDSDSDSSDDSSGGESARMDTEELERIMADNK